MADIVFDKQVEIFELVFADIDQTLSDIAQNDFAHESHPLHKLKEKLEQRLRVLTLCGFNSGKYDLNLVRAYLFKWLKQAGHQPSIIKRDNNYLMISTNKFRFLDISDFIVVGHSYEYYLKAFDVPDSKGFFPYEWFDSAKKLKESSLPPHFSFFFFFFFFFLTLTGNNISDDQYIECLSVWKRENMQTFQDLLIYYNNKICDWIPSRYERTKRFLPS